jgi:prepilin-type processing-associated H-X9-DG protein
MGGGVDAFNCPSADEPFHWKKRYGSGLPKEHGYEQDEYRLYWNSGFCYGYNDWGVHEFTDPHLGLGGHVGHPIHGEVRMTRVKVPGDMIAICDSKADYVWDTAVDPNDFEDNEWPSKRHFGHSEVVFCDGHVERITQAKLIEASQSARRRWNNDHQAHPEYWIGQEPEPDG